MEEIVLKFLSNMGGLGVIGAILWSISKRFMDETMIQVKETQAQMTARITSLERAAEECAKDRRQMHEELFGFIKRGHNDSL